MGMTAQEAVELLNLKYKVWQREELEQLKKLVEQQQQQIEALKCCGNCKQFEMEHINNPLDLNPKCVLFDYFVNPWHKCDKWQGVE